MWPSYLEVLSNEAPVDRKIGELYVGLKRCDATDVVDDVPGEVVGESSDDVSAEKSAGVVVELGLVGYLLDGVGEEAERRWLGSEGVW